jgi:hypothetical protein
MHIIDGVLKVDQWVHTFRVDLDLLLSKKSTQQVAEWTKSCFDKSFGGAVASIDELKAKIKDAEAQFATNRPKIIRRCYWFLIEAQNSITYRIS